MRLKPKFGEVYNVPTTDTATYILVDESGNEFVGVVVDEEQIFTATANDIREGTVAATYDGVTLGTKIIPSYHTTEAVKVVLPGQSFTISFQTSKNDLYDFTKLQAIMCPFNTTLEDSVGAEHVSIDGATYDVKSTEPLSMVSINAETKSIDFGITNTLDIPVLIRYFTYKEIY